MGKLSHLMNQFSPTPHFTFNPAAVIRHYAWGFSGLGALLLLFYAWAAAWPAPILAVDLSQTQLNTPLPAPQENSFSQTFWATHDGLAEVELVLVKYVTLDETPAGQFTLQLFDDQQKLVAESHWSNDVLQHNQTLRWPFPTQTHSAGRPYTLRLSGDAFNQVTAWGYNLPVIPGGHLTHPAENQAQSLRLVTRYQWQWVEAGLIIWQTGREQLWPLLLMLLALPLPGVWFVSLWPHPLHDPIARYGVAWAVGISVWAAGWLWWSWLGGWWSGWLLWVIIAAGWSSWWWWFRPPFTFSLNALLFTLFTLFTLLLRWLAVRDVAFLPWVDASRHALITAVMVQNGQTILHSYEPFLPVTIAPYHYGFHTLSATVQLLAGSTVSLRVTLLTMMQGLSALLPLGLYTGAWLTSRRRSVAWAAAFWVAIPFFFPAYYTTWGRLTQLSGTFLLAVLVGLTWRTAVSRAPQWGAWVATGVIAAGLFLVHFRVFVFYLPLALLVGFILLVQGVWAESAWSAFSELIEGRRPTIATWVRTPLRQLVQAGILALFFVSIKAWQLWQANTAAFQAGGEGYNDFPIGYATFGWELYFWTAGGGGLLWVFWLTFRRKTDTHIPLLYANWLVLLFVGVAGELIGWPVLLPAVNLSSLYIIFFIPQALFLGWLAGYAWDKLPEQHWLIQLFCYVGSGFLVMALLLFGSFQQVDILNEQTILAHPAEVKAIDWLSTHTPPTAKIGISSWRWLLGTWAGSDGGAWITPLTGRRTTTPPVDYSYQAELVYEVQQFNEQASQMADWSTPVADEFLHQHQITHIFVGVRPGFFDPAELSQNPAWQMVYAENGVFIFARSQEE